MLCCLITSLHFIDFPQLGTHKTASVSASNPEGPIYTSTWLLTQLSRGILRIAPNCWARKIWFWRYELKIWEEWVLGWCAESLSRFLSSSHLNARVSDMIRPSSSSLLCQATDKFRPIVRSSFGLDVETWDKTRDVLREDAHSWLSFWQIQKLIYETNRDGTLCMDT